MTGKVIDSLVEPTNNCILETGLVKIVLFILSSTLNLGQKNFSLQVATLKV